MKIRVTPQCRRDLKRLKKKHYPLKEFEIVVGLIVSQDTESLLRRYKDHALKGNLKGFREYHILHDWLLIYKVNRDKDIVELILTRTGTHDELF